MLSVIWGNLDSISSILDVSVVFEGLLTEFLFVQKPFVEENDIGAQDNPNTIKCHTISNSPITFRNLGIIEPRLAHITYTAGCREELGGV